MSFKYLHVEQKSDNNRGTSVPQRLDKKIRIIEIKPKEG